MTDPTKTKIAVEAALRARERHPMGYRDKRTPHFWYARCPVCEQWSPCDVRIMCDAIYPAGSETRDEFVGRKSFREGVQP